MRWKSRLRVGQAMVGVAAVAVALAAARSWDFHRRAPASATLIDPLLKFHALEEHVHRDYQASVGRAVKQDVREFVVKHGSSILPPVVRTIAPGPGRLPAAWALRNAVVRFRRELRHDPALETCFYLPEFVASWRLEEFHRGAYAHYLGLKAEHAVALTDLPAKLMTTLGRAEAAMRRARKDPSIDLYGATAPRLRPGAPLTKR